MISYEAMVEGLLVRRNGVSVAPPGTCPSNHAPGPATATGALRALSNAAPSSTKYDQGS